MVAIARACASRTDRRRRAGRDFGPAGRAGLQRARDAGPGHAGGRRGSVSHCRAASTALHSRRRWPPPSTPARPSWWCWPASCACCPPASSSRYAGRLLNIHPSLLPRHKGLDTHARALAAGDREHGASVHFVTAELDGGPVVLQGRVPVLPGDDVASAFSPRSCDRAHHLSSGDRLAGRAPPGTGTTARQPWMASRLQS